jgi:hypothetical protein
VSRFHVAVDGIHWKAVLNLAVSIRFSRMGSTCSSGRYQDFMENFDAWISLTNLNVILLALGKHRSHM